MLPGIATLATYHLPFIVLIFHDVAADAAYDGLIVLLGWWCGFVPFGFVAFATPLWRCWDILGLENSAMLAFGSSSGSTRAICRTRVLAKAVSGELGA